MLRDVNPSSTLEPSFDSLNVKKFDIAFTVDPLFHKTSAQFDEGGARGGTSLSLILYASSTNVQILCHCLLKESSPWLASLQSTFPTLKTVAIN